MYKAGKLQDSDIYADLKKIITKQKRARENDTEFIYFNSVGLAFIDIAFAYYVYGLLKNKPNLKFFGSHSDSANHYILL